MNYTCVRSYQGAGDFEDNDLFETMTVTKFNY